MSKSPQSDSTEPFLLLISQIPGDDILVNPESQLRRDLVTAFGENRVVNGNEVVDFADDFSDCLALVVVVSSLHPVNTERSLVEGISKIDKMLRGPIPAYLVIISAETPSDAILSHFDALRQIVLVYPFVTLNGEEWKANVENLVVRLKSDLPTFVQAETKHGIRPPITELPPPPCEVIRAS